MLFDLAALSVVDIDPNNLPEAAHYTRFFAYYRESEKVNKEGNRYKDILYLEPCTKQQPCTDTDEILDALRILYTEIQKIRIAVQAIQTGKAPPPPAAPAPGPKPPATTSPAPLPELPVNEARNLFYSLIAPAMATGQISAQTSSDLSQHANGHGWNEAVKELQARLK